MVVIMTINTKVFIFITDNLFNISANAFYDSEASKYIKSEKELNAVTILSRKTAFSDDLSILAQSCGKQVKPFFKRYGLTDYNLWLFAAHGPWQPKTRITKYKKLWKSNPHFKPFTHLTKKSDEIEIESDFGLRYAGMVILENNSLIQGIELLRKDSACCIIASNRSDVYSSSSLDNLM